MRKAAFIILSVFISAGFVFGQNLNDLWFKQNDGKITILRYLGRGGTVTIPSAINGLPVTAIQEGFNGYYAENGLEYQPGVGLTSVTIPSSVTYIDSQAFTGNPLTSITIGANVTFRDYGRQISFMNGFETAYINGGRQAGTYTRPDLRSETWTRGRDTRTLLFPSAFTGTWVRDNFNNCLTFSENTFFDNGQWDYNVPYLVSVSGDSYTFSRRGLRGATASITIRITGNNLVISGDSGEGQDNWNGTWHRVER